MGSSSRILFAVLGVAVVAAACTPGDSEPATTLEPIVTVEPFVCEAGAGVNELLVPECGVLLGTTDPPGGEGVPTGLAHQERVVSATLPAAERASADMFRFDLVRVYQRGSRGAVAALNRRLDELDDDPGRLLFWSWKVSTGRGEWAAVAAGDYDDELAAFADAVAAGGHTIFLSLHHEPEGDTDGLPSDYVAMWRHAHDLIESTIAAADGDGDVVWVANYQGHVDGEDLDEIDDYYPGSDYVDWLSYNPYNWAVCRRNAEWRSFHDVASPLYRYFTTQPQFRNADGSQKPIMIGETGTNEDPDDSARKAEWLGDMASTLEEGKLPEIKALIYFNQAAPDFCDRHWDSSPASAQAFAEITARPFFDPQTPDG